MLEMFARTFEISPSYLVIIGSKFFQIVRVSFEIRRRKKIERKKMSRRILGWCDNSYAFGRKLFRRGKKWYLFELKFFLKLPPSKERFRASHRSEFKLTFKVEHFRNTWRATAYVVNVPPAKTCRRGEENSYSKQGKSEGAVSSGTFSLKSLGCSFRAISDLSSLEQRPRSHCFSNKYTLSRYIYIYRQPLLLSWICCTKFSCVEDADLKIKFYVSRSRFRSFSTKIFFWNVSLSIFKALLWGWKYLCWDTRHRSRSLIYDLYLEGSLIKFKRKERLLRSRDEEYSIWKKWYKVITIFFPRITTRFDSKRRKRGGEK